MNLTNSKTAQLTDPKAVTLTFKILENATGLEPGTIRHFDRDLKEAEEICDDWAHEIRRLEEILRVNELVPAWADARITRMTHEALRLAENDDGLAQLAYAKDMMLCKKIVEGAIDNLSNPKGQFANQEYSTSAVWESHRICTRETELVGFIYEYGGVYLQAHSLSFSVYSKKYIRFVFIRNSCIHNNCIRHVSMYSYIL